MKAKKYIVFEAGSRAGLSAEIFFRAWQKQNGWENGNGDVLYLADSDPTYCSVPSQSENIIRISEQEAVNLIQSGEDVVAFPGDELTRQLNPVVRNAVQDDDYARVSPLWYDKAHVNNVLAELVSIDQCKIRISGTSLVNLANGFNPFCFMNRVKTDVIVTRFEDGKWFRYEDFVLDIENEIRCIV